jgi:hypothetical protein
MNRSGGSIHPPEDSSAFPFLTWGRRLKHRKAFISGAHLRFTSDVFQSGLGQPRLVRYWLVHNERTLLRDIAGDYLWLRGKKTGGGRAHSCDNARVAAPGDVVLSSVRGRIGHVGRVTGRALSESGGWWLPVAWTPLARRLPEMGKAPPGAGLAEIAEEVFNAILDESDSADWLTRIPDADDPEPVAQVADPRLGYGAALDASVRDQLIRARRGQGLFRFRVFQIESACRLTGIANPHLLIASHIRPWRLCETTHERLDGSNGLLLTPHVDRLFDRGLISFSKDGDVLRSPRLSADDLRRLGLAEACGRNAGAFSERQQVYLEWHRADVFDGGAG